MTPILLKMLRRCVSTVFWLRNSSAAIWALVWAVCDEPGYLQFAFGQRFDSSRLGLARPRAPVDVPAELSQLALCLVAIAERAEGVECRRGSLEFKGGTVAVACPSECSSREFPRAGCVPECCDRLERGGCARRNFGDRAASRPTVSVTYR